MQHKHIRAKVQYKTVFIAVLQHREWLVGCN